jgi:hypothetical protein
VFVVNEGVTYVDPVPNGDPPTEFAYQAYCPVDPLAVNVAVEPHVIVAPDAVGADG